MKIVVKTIDVDHAELFKKLFELNIPFKTNRDTFTFLNATQEDYKKLMQIKAEYELKKKTIMVIQGI